MVVAASDGFTQWLMDPEANVDAAMELEALVHRPMWMRDAACQGMSTPSSFPSSAAPPPRTGRLSS
jgi:hypothetical protein